jgi:HPt (histidine-containing phosphotransfer) domain-containing protein
MDNAPTNPPNLALAQLMEVVGPDDVRELVDTYLKEFDGLIRTLAGGDREAQHRAAHALKSSSRHMGLLTLAGRLQALEMRLLQPTGQVTTQDLVAITEEFNRASKPLRTFVSTGG